jgi:hypothetical protein
MTQQDYSRYFRGLYNVSGFDGTIESDFLKLGSVPDDRKPDLIDYNLKGFDDYRTALQNYLKAVFPTDYNNFAASDLGQMLLEMFAYMASVNTLRADMTANEMYIDTVKDPDNLKRLLQLIGVTMRGPTSSKATGKLTLPPEVTITTDVVVPQGSRTISVTSDRSNVPLLYTMTRQLNDGSLDLFNRDLTIPQADFTNNEVSDIFLLEGSFETQTGAFAADATRQTIELRNGPVVEGSIGVSSTEGIIYNEISNLFVASGGTDAVFEKVYTDGFNAVLRFGDGVRGRMPTPGETFVVNYRRGAGENGNIARGIINKSVALTHGGVPVNGTLVNITKGTGGSPAETVEHAKRYGPYFFRTQYRAVTGEDYNALANSFVGTTGKTAKAMASLRKNGAAANVIDMFVLSKASDTQLERASVAFKKELLDYMQQYKMLTDDIVISDGVVRTLDIVASVFIDRSNERFEDNIKQKAANKLQEYFSVDRVNFGQRLDLSDLQNFMLTVPEIRFFTVDNLERDVPVNFNEIVQLNNFEFSVEFV